MTRTKRQENSIIISFIFFLFLIAISIIYILSSILPRIKLINEKKVETQALYNSMVELNNKGLSLSGFLDLASKDSTLPEYKKELINSIDLNFYNKYFENKKTGKYIDFINSQGELNDENKKVLEEKDLYIVDILPYYSEGYTGSGSFESLTNFKFVAYIESLLETFDLETTDAIGIKDIDLVESYSSKESGNNPLEKNIYSIPIKLSIEGKKRGIIQFLTYVENVGKISIDENEVISVISDKTNIFGNTKLINDKKTTKYNIFKHQIIDIENISFSEYIDSYSKIYNSSEKEFIDFIKEDEGNESYKIEVELLFYVRGYPFYELETYINGIYEQYNQLKGILNTLINDKTIDNYGLLKITKANDYLNGIAKDMTELRKDSQNKEKIENAIKKLNVYKTNFETISKIEKVKIKLDEIKNQKEKSNKKN